MNMTELKKALPILMKNGVVPFIWGPQGAGKTQGVKQIGEENSLDFIHLHLATQQDVGDIVGLLIKNADGTVKHARPEWFPTSGKGIIFLDELNRAHPDIIQAMFSFITNKTIHTHKLPDGWHIVAAGNYQSNMFNVTDTSDAAWMSRFCHIDFTPTKEEFCLYAEDNDAFEIAKFIRTHGDCLEVNHKEKLNYSMITPDRRSWFDMISKLEKEEELENVRYEIYSGIIGQTAAATFLTFKKKQFESISGRDILFSYPKVQEKIKKLFTEKESRFDVLNSATEELITFLSTKKLKDENISNLKSFILDIPTEMSLKIINMLHGINFNGKSQILNNEEFVGKYKKLKLQKNMARL
jgi:hypothetical protein